MTDRASVWKHASEGESEPVDAGTQTEHAEGMSHIHAAPCSVATARRSASASRLARLSLFVRVS